MLTTNTPGCSICDPDVVIGEGQARMCHLCAHPDRVRTFCTKCKLRLDMDRGRGYELMVSFGYRITLPIGVGFVIRFDGGCPECLDDLDDSVLTVKTFMVQWTDVPYDQPIC